MNIFFNKLAVNSCPPWLHVIFPLIKKLDYDNITLSIDGKTFAGGYSLNVGNPHIVFFVKDCFKYNLKVLGPKIENHKIFDEQASFSIERISSP